jgi:hypothetical protein
MLHVCESRTSHFRSIASLFVQISLLEFLLMYEDEFEREKNAIFLSSSSVNHTMRIADVKRVTNLSSWRARTTENEKCFFSWKRTFLAYDDVTVLLFLRLSFSKDLLWITSCDDKNVLRSRIVCATLIDSVLFMLLWNDLNIALLTLVSSVKNIREMLTLVCWCFISEKYEWNCEKRAFR